MVSAGQRGLDVPDDFFPLAALACNSSRRRTAGGALAWGVAVEVVPQEPCGKCLFAASRIAEQDRPASGRPGSEGRRRSGWPRHPGIPALCSARRASRTARGT